MERSVRRHVLVGAIVVVVLTAALPFLVRQEAEAVGGNWLAFVRDPTGAGNSFESGDEEIYAIRVDGSGAVRLTSNACIDITPAASPNGRWLAWVQKCGNVVDIVMAPISYTDGQLGIGHITNVTSFLGYGSDRWPQFSPDGSKLAFIRRTNGNFDIWRASFSGSGGTLPAISDVTRVVRLGGTLVEDCCVTWSPDGGHLVWASNVNRYQQSFNLYRIPSTATEVWDATRNVDGSGDGTLDVTVAQQLTFGREYEGTPQYDADGTVLFRCNCPNGDVYRLNVSTKTRTRLTTHLGLDRTPEGYPGGITYSRYDNVGADEIYVAGPNGESPTNVTRHPWADRDPTWIPAQNA